MLTGVDDIISVTSLIYFSNNRGTSLVLLVVVVFACAFQKKKPNKNKVRTISGNISKLSMKTNTLTVPNLYEWKIEKKQKTTVYHMTSFERIVMCF